MAINDWNAQHAAAEGIVLLPVKWETHARPESGVRPQGAINTQIVQTCDILIGMFWTKLGTDTGVAESGTVEEINQFVEQKKPALLYFSDRLTAPSAINLEQLRKLKDFKDTTYSQALVGSFCSVDELRTKLLRDLTGQVRTLPPVRRRLRRTEKLDEAQNGRHDPVHSRGTVFGCGLRRWSFSPNVDCRTRARRARVGSRLLRHHCCNAARYSDKPHGSGYGVSADAGYAKLNDQTPITVANGLVKLADALTKSVGLIAADAQVSMVAGVTPYFVWAFIISIIVFMGFSFLIKHDA
jgi:hypothetical protein